MAGRNRKRLNGALLQAAAAYGLAARHARGQGLAPLKSPAGRRAASRLVAAVKKFHRDWTAFRTEQGRPPMAAEQPLPPHRTPEGAVIRLAKALGHAFNSTPPDKENQASLLHRLLAAAEAMAQTQKDTTRK